jgi:hypothetical protein
MPATLYNAPARPLLTGLVLLVLAMVLLAVLSLAFTFHGPGRRDPSAPDRPMFTRRIATLPAMVVTGPAATPAPEVYETPAP